MAASSSVPVDHPDARSPLTAVSPLDQTGVIAILAGFSVGLILLSTGVRLYARRFARAIRPDDFAFYFAVFFAITQTALAFYLISQGLGKAVRLLDQDELTSIRRGEFASNLLYIIVLALSKMSCALMFLWLTPYEKQLAQTMLTFSSMWLVGSVFAEGFLHQDFPEYTARSFTQWLYISIFDVAIEVALILSSIYVVWNRQMCVRAKWTVVGAFACRMPNIACTLTRLVFLKQPLTPASSSYWAARVQSVTQLAIAYTVTACVIPYLRPLMQAYEPDRSRRSSSTTPNFKLSERSSKASVVSSRRSGSWGLFRIPSAPGRHHARASRQDSILNMDVADIGGLLMPQKAVLARARSEDDSIAVKTRDWGVMHGARQDSASSQISGQPVVNTGLDGVRTVPLSYGTGMRGVRHDEDEHPNDTGDIV